GRRSQHSGPEISPRRHIRERPAGSAASPGISDPRNSGDAGVHPEPGCRPRPWEHRKADAALAPTNSRTNAVAEPYPSPPNRPRIVRQRPPHPRESPPNKGGRPPPTLTRFFPADRQTVVDRLRTA